MAIAIIWQFMAIYGNQHTLPRNLFKYNFIFAINLVLQYVIILYKNLILVQLYVTIAIISVLKVIFYRYIYIWKYIFRSMCILEFFALILYTMWSKLKFVFIIKFNLLVWYMRELYKLHIWYYSLNSNILNLTLIYYL